MTRNLPARMGLTARSIAAISLAAILLIGAATGLRAQPVIDQFVSGADLMTVGNCSLLRVNFHVRIRYVGHFPPDHGNQLSISLQLVDREGMLARRLAPREGVRVENAHGVGIRDVYLALDESRGPVLVVLFGGEVQYQVVQSGSFEQVAVLIARKGPASACKLSAFPIGMAESVRRDVGPPRKLSPADRRMAEASMDEARAAIRKGNYPAAIAILKKTLQYQENSVSPEAQELLGVARQKAGHTAEAIAEYEDYLRRYPTGEGSDRVRQRLAAIQTAVMPERPREQPGQGPEPYGVRKPPSTGETRWTMSGSLSTTFVTNDSNTTAKDLSRAPNPNADPDAHRIHQNTLMSNFDLFGSSDNEQVRTKFKLAFTHERRFDNQTDKYGVSTAQVDYTLKEYDLTARVGRQSRNTGGVIGRFDGAVLSWQYSPAVRFNVLAGSPNWSRFDAPFKDNKSLYGASIDFGKIFGGIETSIYAITQYDSAIIDRQAIGAEFRYFDANKSALGTIDYDTHFQQLNAAIFSGSYTLEDKSVINTALDYRKVPFLSTWNALQGQPFLTLYDMMKFNAAGDVRQFAIDRTPTFSSAMVGYSKPLGETWQVSSDATVTHLSGTLPSGGVDGTMASGLEYYVSTQLTGNGIFKPGDLFMAAVRYANLAESRFYVLDFNTRYPLSPDLAVSPRLRLGYRTGTHTDLKELTILPSFLVIYLWSKELSMEAEVGYRFTDSTLNQVKSAARDLFGTITLRHDFGVDGVSTRCRASIVSCAWAKGGTSEEAARNSPGAGLPLRDQDASPRFYALETGLRYWYSSGKNRYNYFADQTATTQVSRLDYNGLTGHAGEAFFRFDAYDGPLANMFLKGYVGAGAVSGGKMIDDDFTPFVTPSSRTSSSASGQLQYGSVDLGFNLIEAKRVRLGAFVGYHYWMETVDARGCAQIGGNPVICMPALGPNIKVVTEQDRWHSGRAGVAVDARIWDRLSWQGEVAYVWTSQKAIDTHYFTFGRDPASGHGSGFQAETVFKFHLNDAFSLGIGGRWWHFSTDAVDTFNQLLRYNTDRYGVFVQGSYKFN